MKRLKFLLLFSLLSGSLIAQVTAISKEQLLGGLAIYRSELLRNNTENTKALGQFYKYLDSLGFSENEQAHYTFDMLYAALARVKLKKAKQALKERLPNSNFYEYARKEDYPVLRENVDLLGMIQTGLLRPEYPFKIDTATLFFEELAFYQIENGMRIGEVGAGLGTMSILLATVYDHVDIYVNELAIVLRAEIENLINRTKSIREANRLYVIKGKKKSTRMEGLELDKIIVRKTLHHFNKMEEMLESIRLSLKEEGELLIYEATTDFPSDGHLCDRLLSMKQIESIMHDNSWKLKRKKELKGVVLYNYVFAGREK